MSNTTVSWAVLQDTKVLRDFDIVATAGWRTAVTREFETTVEPGKPKLVVRFQHVDGFAGPKISAIEVYRL